MSSSLADASPALGRLPNRIALSSLTRQVWGTGVSLADNYAIWLQAGNPGRRKLTVLGHLFVR
jgi:hypothetical protein